MSLEICPLDFDEAKELVRRWHRHHGEPLSHKFSIGVINGDGDVCGAAICGRPVARHLDEGWTIEVYRVATDGTRNACSALYGACRRVAFAMGYQRIITYTLKSEPGSSLRGAGWKELALRRPRAGWSTPARPRVDRGPKEQKRLWESAQI